MAQFAGNISDKDYKLIKEAAEKDRRNVSSLFRKAAIDYAKQIMENDRHLKKYLNQNKLEEIMINAGVKYLEKYPIRELIKLIKKPNEED